MASSAESPEAGTTTISRTIRKKECFLCGGNGRVPDESPNSGCAHCHGMGWTTNASGEEIVCPTCNGDGSMASESNLVCDHCTGKGYVVKIVEIRRGKSACPACAGSGVVVIKDFQLECPRCRGQLWIKDDSGDIKICPTCCGKARITVREERDNKCETCNGEGTVDDECEVDVTPVALTEVDRLYRLEEANRLTWTPTDWLDHSAAWKKLGRAIDEKRCLEMSRKDKHREAV